MNKNLARALALVAIAVALVLQFSPREAAHSALDIPPSQGNLSDAVVTVIETGETNSPAEVRAPVRSQLAVPSDASPSDGDRQVARPSPGKLRVKVSSLAGQLLPAATVSWTELPGDLPTGPPTIPWLEDLAERTLFRRTAEDGVALYPSIPPFVSSHSSVLWISHPAYHAQAILLPAGLKAWQSLRTVVLEPAAPLSAVVKVGASLQASPPASAQTLTLWQSGLDPDAIQKLDPRNTWLEKRPGTPDTAAGRAALAAFIRFQVVEPGAPQALPRGPLPTVLLCATQDQVSPLVITDPTRQHESLQPFPQLEASGKVRLPDDALFPDDAQVLCSWSEGLEQPPLALLKIASNGTWGPVLLPAFQTGVYHFQLQGGELVPQTRDVPSQSTPSSIWVEFEAQLGQSQPVRVTDREGQPLAGAKVDIEWEAHGQTVRASGWSDREGMALVRGCPMATAIVRASKPGHVTLTHERVYITYPDPPHEISLAPAGRLSGRVTHAGQPVEAFQVFTWQDDPSYRQKHLFTGRTEGTFELDNVALGPLTLAVTSADFPKSEALRITLEKDELAEVAIALPLGVRGTGRVLDAFSGLPLPGASVELLSNQSGRRLGGRGRHVPVASDGTFVIEGVGAANPVIEASSPGRVSSRTTGTLNARGEVQFSNIALAKHQSLRVEVHSKSPIERVLWFQSYGESNISLQRLDASGGITIADVAPGMHRAELVFQDGTISSKDVRLLPGEDWLIEYEYASDSNLLVDVLPAEGQALPASIGITAEYFDALGARIMRTQDAGPHVLFENIPDGPLSLAVIGDTWDDQYGAAEIVVTSDRSQPFALRLGQRVLEITVSDEHGVRAPEATVYVDAIHGVGISHYQAALPPDKPIRLALIASDEVLVTAYSRSLGLGFTEARQKPRGTTVVEVQLGGADLDLRIEDQDGPVEGVQMMLVPAGVDALGFYAKTDAEGLAVYHGLPDRTYSASLTRYGYWPVKHNFEFHGQSPVRLNLRRRGEVEWTIRTPAGRPHEGATLRLHSTEFDRDLSDWLATRKLSPAAVQLTSDAAGLCFARGIPHGHYTWSVQLPDGTSSTGECDVPPGAVGTFEVLIGL